MPALSSLTEAFAALDTMTWFVLALAAALGGVLRGLTGFGAALAMAPLLSRVLPAHHTLVLVTVLCALPLGPTLSRRAIWTADGTLLRPMLLAAMVGLPAGVWLVGLLPEQAFRTLVGVSVIVSACALLAGLRFPRRASRPASLGVGLLSGVMTAFGGIGGPPAILYVLGVERDPVRIRANFIVYFACLYPLALVVLALLGVLSLPLLVLGLLLAPLFHAGCLLGAGLFGRMDKRLFRPLVLALLFSAGALAAWPRG